METTPPHTHTALLYFLVEKGSDISFLVFTAFLLKTTGKRSRTIEASKRRVVVFSVFCSVAFDPFEFEKKTYEYWWL